MRESGANLAATSANFAGEPPIESISDVDNLFSPPPTIAVDGGLVSGAASTVVDTTTDPVSIPREGAVTAEMLALHI
jgi:tRNA A37 threonylcarbamoyladenosine synthetase subunit TsaC/SUA5/YrdC